MSTTPTNVLLYQVAEWPLVHGWKYLLGKTLFKCWNSRANPLKCITKDWYESLCTNKENLNKVANQSIKFISTHFNHFTEINSETLPGVFNFPLSTRFSHINVDLNSFNYIRKYKNRKGNFWYKGSKWISLDGLKRLFKSTLNKLNLSLVLYTDGSVLRDRSVFSEEPEIRESIPVHNSSNISLVEALAILRAIKIASKLGFPRVGILSDSRSVLKNIAHLDYSGKKHHIIYSILTEIEQAKRNDIDILLVSRYWCQENTHLELETQFYEKDIENIWINFPPPPVQEIKT